jgi:hypothetical protein
MDDQENEFNLEQAKRQGFDRADRVVSRSRERTTPNWLAICVAVLSIVVQVGTLAWYGGRISQRVDNLEAVQVEQRQRDANLAEDNGRQNVTLGIIGQQYGDISRRLSSIESKLDRQ